MSKNPQVVWCEASGDDTPEAWYEASDLNATHEVLLLGGLHVYRDENGDWPQSVVDQIADTITVLEFGENRDKSPWFKARVILRALAAQEGEQT